MNFLHWPEWYVQWNVLVVVLAVTVALLPAKKQFTRSLKWIYLLIAISVVVPLLTPLSSNPKFISPSARDWVASNFHPEVRRGYEFTQSLVRTPLATPSTHWLRVVFLVSVLGTFARLIWFCKGIWSLNAVRKRSFLWKQIGRNVLLLSDEVNTPFSFRGFRRHYLCFPSFLVEKRDELRLALRHESQHHRQGDTAMVYGLELMKAVLWCNPFAFLLSKKISEIQEFACDEAATRGREFQAYVRCLLTVAKTPGRSRYQLVGTTSLAVGDSSSLLKRRIQMLFQKKTKSTPTRISLLVVPFLVASGLMFALSTDIPDRVISEAEATQLVTQVSNSDFPLTVNPQVLKYLNYFVGTPKGREFMKNALARMENYRPMIEKKLRQYQLPLELMALPLIESGYQNLPQQKHGFKSAGVWQITPMTGKNFGLQPDDRMNVELATDMALRLLSADFLRFMTWELSVVAYNAGENKLQDGIFKTGSRDAWYLIEKGYGGDEGYLAKFMAAVIIMKSPNILE